MKVKKILKIIKLPAGAGAGALVVVVVVVVVVVGSEAQNKESNTFCVLVSIKKNIGVNSCEFIESN